MAKSGQRSSHWLHAMHASGLATFTTNPSIARTFVGQNSTQMLHPLQYLSMTSISAFALLITVFLLFEDVASCNGLVKRRNLITFDQYMPEISVYSKYCALVSENPDAGTGSGGAGLVNSGI
jgi:hypothetical protein